VKKVGILRCQQTEDMCPGTKCLTFPGKGAGAFAKTGSVEVVGFLTCGGCPGKKVARRAKVMIDKGAEAIVLASCITKDNIPKATFRCDYSEKIIESIRKFIGDEVEIIDWTH
jgi:predicted metal-binding protein